MKKIDFLVFIGRCQPPHNGHIQTLNTAFHKAKHVIVMLGSSFRPRDPENPWTWQERKEMIQSCFNEEQNSRLHIYPARDTRYNDEQWIKDRQDTVQECIKEIWTLDTPPTIRLIGHKKDHRTSQYLTFFPQWNPIVEIPLVDDLHATEIRQYIFDMDLTYDIDYKMPQTVGALIRDFKQTEEYYNIRSEYTYIQHYKQKWGPGPFQTADACVVQSGHVLLIKRKNIPGAGLLALPGGFIHLDEFIQEGMLRELREETKIDVPTKKLQGCIRDTKTFDHPRRSLRGRIITQASLIVLPHEEKLPTVRGSDDAKEAMWVPWNEALSQPELFFEDHYDMVSYFHGKI